VALLGQVRPDAVEERYDGHWGERVERSEASECIAHPHRPVGRKVGHDDVLDADARLRDEADNISTQGDPHEIWYRFGDVSSSWVSSFILPFGVAGLAIFGAITAAIWFPVAYALGKRYEGARGGDIRA